MILQFLLAVIIVAIASKELIFVNEEVLVILSFLLFLTGAFSFGSATLAESLDSTAEELKLKLEELSKAQVNALKQSKKTREEALKVTEKLVPTYASILGLLGTIDEVSEEFLIEVEKQKMDLKIKSLLQQEIEVESDIVFNKAEVFFAKYLRADSVEGEFVQETKFSDSKQSIYLNNIARFSSNLVEDKNWEIYFTVLGYLNLQVFPQLVK